MKPFFLGILGLVASTVLVSFAAQAAERQAAVTTLEGAQIRGVLKNWNSAEVTVATGDVIDTFASERLLEIRWPSSRSAPKPITAFLELLDGTRLPFVEYVVVNRQATVTTPLAKNPLTISTADIRRVQFTSLVEQIAPLWRELQEKQLDGDVLVVHKKEATTLDYLTGVVGDVSSSQVRFKWEGDEIPVKRSKVAAIAYYHVQSPEYPEAVCWLSTSDGAKLPLASFVVEGDHVQLTTIGGLELRSSLDALQVADYSVGKLTYLSDMNPVRQKWTPRIELPASAKLIRGFGEPRRDQSFAGSTLSLAWPQAAKESSRGVAAGSEIKLYTKGLALRSRTELIYRLPPNMKRFVATAGIDPATAQQGNVQLEISADGRIAWQGEIDGGAPPIEIQFDLDGARELRIFVDYGANLDYGDRLHLVDARVTK